MKLDFLVDNIKHHQVVITDEGDYESAKIINPNTDNDICVYYGYDDVDSYSVYFATNHHHCENEQDVLEIVLSYISGELNTIEFYTNGEPSFGGCIKTDVVKNLTPESLAECFSYRFKNLFDKVFKIRSWSGENDFSGRVVKCCEEYDLVMLPNADDTNIQSES